MSPLISGGDTSLVAEGPYSLGYDDPANAWDAPIPGFVGPYGDGKAPLSDGSNSGNTLNPVFTGWGSAGSPETGVVDGVEYVPAYIDNIEYEFAFQFFGTGPLDFVTQYVIVDSDNEEYEAYGVYTVSLGELPPTAVVNGEAPGHITLWFEKPIHDVPGADLVVYENGFISGYNQGGVGVGGVFAELAFVEVSTDGENFARFPSISLTEADAAPLRYGSMDPSLIYNLAGKHVNSDGDSWGTPFDLSTLLSEANVVNGLVDLENIRFVRIVDVCGIGVYNSGGVDYVGAVDSLGNVIYDPYRTTGSGGFDLDAIGAIGQPIYFDEWNAGRGLVPAGDDDGDGVSNLLEYAFDMNPAAPDPNLLPRMERVDGQPVLRFRRDVRNSDIVYLIEATDSLTAPDWQVVARAQAFSDPEVLLTDPTAAELTTESRHTEASLGVWQEVCFTDKALNSPRFYRVRVDTVDEQ
ncbi:MAG: hypothetical protein Q7Q73_03995 [Verrucomicrobiota bacterium JB024]|nr:hypothetical protein [Verrucomicrobiota bacterium JB024]